MSAVKKKLNKLRGFTLVELMVSMVIGTIILSAVITVMVNSNANYHVTDSMARLQENARFAMHFMTTDLRRAGYMGCSDDISNINSTLNGAPLGGSGGLAIAALEGLENVGTGVWQPSGTVPSMPNRINNTDAFFVRYLDQSNAVAIMKEMPSRAAVLFVSAGHGLMQDDIITVSDCDSADIMQLTNVNGGGGGDNLVHNSGGGTPGNKTQRLSKPYGIGASVLKLQSFAYYIGNGTRGPALFRSSFAGAEELVEGIDNLQIMYGIVTTSDRIPSLYLNADGVTAANAWPNVISVRFAMLASTVASTRDGEFGVDKDMGAYNVNGTTITATGDRRIRNVFTSTVLMRNIK